MASLSDVAISFLSSSLEKWAGCGSYGWDLLCCFPIVLSASKPTHSPTQRLFLKLTLIWFDEKGSLEPPLPSYLLSVHASSLPVHKSASIGFCAPIKATCRLLSLLRLDCH